MSRTAGSLEERSCIWRDTCCILNRAVKDGILKLPLRGGRKRREGLVVCDRVFVCVSECLFVYVFFLS